MKHLFWLLWFTFIATATAKPLGESFNGELVELSNQPVHLIFFDVWQDGYSEHGPVAGVLDLPPTYLARTQRVWIIPPLNITNAQITEFVEQFPAVDPLIVDKNFSLMRRYNVWKTPEHIVLEKSQVKFRGNSKDLKHHVLQETNP